MNAATYFITFLDVCFFLGVTILLSLTVFHNLVAEKLPQVSDAMPILGTIQQILYNCYKNKREH
jgi:hypothetical protein